MAGPEYGQFQPDIYQRAMNSYTDTHDSNGTDPASLSSRSLGKGGDRFGHKVEMTRVHREGNMADDGEIHFHIFCGTLGTTSENRMRCESRNAYPPIHHHNKLFPDHPIQPPRKLT